MFEINSNMPREKKALYETILEQAQGLMTGESDAIANMANISSLLYHSLEQINWAGFYLMKEGELVLGPFHGKPACIRIPLGKGVCGRGAYEKITQVVPDVHKFPGHIPCDGDTNSEIVIPMILKGRVLGVLDIDSPCKERFLEEDKQGLEQLVNQLIEACNWEEI